MNSLGRPKRVHFSAESWRLGKWWTQPWFGEKVVLRGGQLFAEDNFCPRFMWLRPGPAPPPRKEKRKTTKLSFGRFAFLVRPKRIHFFRVVPKEFTFFGSSPKNSLFLGRPTTIYFFWVASKGFAFLGRPKRIHVWGDLKSESFGSAQKDSLF